jgi:uncharacterized protein
LAKSSERRKLIADSGALVALLSRDDVYHSWLAAHLDSLTVPWLTCDAALTEAFYLLGRRGGPNLSAVLKRGAVRPAFNLAEELNPVLTLMNKYRDVPMSLADACLVRMSEIVSDAVLITTDTDFRIYRRHGRSVIPCLMP